MLSLVELLAPIGIVQIIRYSTLFGDEIPLREDARQVPFLKNLVDCSLCLGFWAGLAVYVAAHYPAAAVWITGLGVASGTLWGIIRGSPTWSKLLSYSTMGAMVGAFPLMLLAPLFVGTEAEPMLVEMFLAGLCSAPICYVSDMLITYTENKTKY